MCHRRLILVVKEKLILRLMRKVSVRFSGVEAFAWMAVRHSWM